MNVQQQQIPSIDAYFSLKESLEGAKNRDQKAPRLLDGLKDRIEVINRCNLSGTKPEYQEKDITQADVKQLNEALKKSKTIRKEAFSKLGFIQKIGYGLLSIFGYRGYVPQIDASKFVKSVDEYHVKIKADKLEQALELPRMKEEDLRIPKDMTCYRAWRDADKGGALMITLSQGGKHTHYKCTLDQLNKGLVVLENRANREDTIPLRSERFKSLFQAQKGGELVSEIEKQVQQKNQIKSYGQVQLEALLERHSVKEQQGKGIPARLRECHKHFQKDVYAITRSGDHYIIKTCRYENNAQGVREQKVGNDMRITVDSQGKVMCGDKEFGSVQLFEASLRDGIFLDVAEAEMTQTDAQKEAINATKKSITDGAKQLKIFSENAWDAQVVLSDLQDHIKSGHVKPQDMGAAVTPAYESNKMNVVAVVDGEAKILPITIQNDGKIEFRGKGYDAKTPLADLLKGITLNPMEKARGEYNKGLSELQKVCNEIKKGENYYGYDTSIKLYEEYDQFFAPEKLAGTCVINPGKAPEKSKAAWYNPFAIIKSAFMAAYKYVVPKVVNDWGTPDFKEFTISLHDGKTLEHYEVTIDLDNKAAPFKHGDTHYAKPEDIIKEKLVALAPRPYTKLKEMKEKCEEREVEIAGDPGLVTASKRDDMIEYPEVEFVEGDYSVVHVEKSKGEYEITFYKGKGDAVEPYTAKCSTREVPGKIVILSEAPLHGDTITFKPGKQVDSVERYLATHALPRVRPMKDVRGESVGDVDYQPVYNGPQVGEMLNMDVVSRLQDFVPFEELKGMGIQEKANKYAVTWNEGARLNIYDAQGSAPVLEITRDGGKFVLEGEERRFDTLVELVKHKVGNMNQVRPLGHMVDTVVAGKKPLTPPQPAVQPPRADIAHRETHFANLKITNTNKNVQVMHRLVAARYCMNDIGAEEWQKVRAQVKEMVFEGSDPDAIVQLLAGVKGTKAEGNMLKDLKIGAKIPKGVLEGLPKDDRKVGKGELHKFAQELAK